MRPPFDIGGMTSHTPMSSHPARLRQAVLGGDYVETISQIVRSRRKFYSRALSRVARRTGSMLMEPLRTKSSLKECALRPVPNFATGQRRAVSSLWKRYGIRPTHLASDKDFIGRCGCPLTNNKGADHELTAMALPLLSALRPAILPTRSSQVDRPDPSHTFGNRDSAPEMAIQNGNVSGDGNRDVGAHWAPTMGP